MSRIYLFFVFFLTSFLSICQTSTINPDTVCYQTGGSIYTVPSLGPGYSYTWNILAPGVITSGQGTNVLNVDWSSANPGLINNAVTVFATNITTGCQSPPITLNVYIYNVVVNMNSVGPFCEGASCVNLTGNPVGGIFSGNGVVNGQFCPSVSGSGNFILTYTVISNGCSFSNTSNVTVNPNPVLLPIQHN